MSDLRSGDFLLSVLGLAASRDLFRATDRVTARTAEMRQVLEHTDEFPYDIEIDFDEHDVVSGYTTWADTYDGPGTNPALALEESVTDRILARAPRGRALDVACGTGKSALPLVERGYELTACDSSAGMLARARRALPESVELFQADMRELPAIGSFDLITCLDDAVNYLPGDDDLARALASMAELLAPGGLIVFDNMLQSGRVVDEPDANENTAAIVALNAKLRSDPRVVCVMLTVRDGVTLVRRAA